MKAVKSINQVVKSMGEKYLLSTYAPRPVCFVKGKGSWVWDGDGKRYLDFVSGIAVNNLGYGDAGLARVIGDQAKKITHTSNIFWIENQVLLARELVELSGLHKAFFCNSGTEAVEACIKFARHWGVSQAPDRYEIIVMENSFHGRTLGSLSATMQKKYQDGFGPLLPGFKSVPFNNLSAVESAINQNTCAVLLEPIQAEGGINVPSPDYLPALAELCRKQNILLILDEVQVGIGRTGRLFSFLADKIKPDLVSLAKGLGAGFPIGACLVSERVAKLVHPGMHASTFGGNHLACRVGLEVLARIGQKKFLAEVREKGRYFQKRLLKIKKKYPVVIDVRGRGLIWGLELAREAGPEIAQKAFEQGLILNMIKNKIIRFVPPLIMNRNDMDHGLDIVDSLIGDL